MISSVEDCGRMKRVKFRMSRRIAGFHRFYHGLQGNATGIQLLLSAHFATFF
jgi:hypothetical protein